MCIKMQRGVCRAGGEMAAGAVPWVAYCRGLPRRYSAIMRVDLPHPVRPATPTCAPQNKCRRRHISAPPSSMSTQAHSALPCTPAQERTRMTTAAALAKP
jgi:hypothetical protein